MKVAIFHWAFDYIGGGEVFANDIGKALDAPVYSIVNTENKFNFIDISHKLSFFTKKIRKIRTLDYFTWPSIDPTEFGDFDLILTSGSTTRSMIVPENIPHVNMCLSTPRWLYDLWHIRKKSTNFGSLITPFAEAMRIWDGAVDTRVDYYITISEVIKRRLWHYLKRDSDIIYPPIDVSKYKNRDSEDYFLFLSRIEPEKRPEETIQACIKGKQKLIVAGTGSILKKLQSKYKNNQNISFTGYVDEDTKIDLLAHCEALIYPSIAEDFGIVPVESLASGKPVICSNDGFPPILIKDKYGVITNGTVQDISWSMEHMPEFNSSDLMKYAEQFDFSIFKEKLNKQLEIYMKDFQEKL